jgi:glycine hydroxymethyltransferase
MSDFLFRGSLADLDPDVYKLTQLEAERQARKLILIASESQAPLAVREAMGSAFQNIYAEGYPDEETRLMSDKEILDYPRRLAHYRRYSDPRHYKGVEYADAIEALARRRCAEAFAANGVSADQIFVNVQALSGGPANNAVYHALVTPGDTVMGLTLLHGGHLSHGSSANRSGKYYKIVHYKVDENERLDYEKIREQALEARPKMIIAGYSSYSWVPDWAKFRAIADEVGAYLLTDISHIGGLVAAGVVPSPMGYAHVITSTTHKTLHGPRGAVILTTDPELAKKLDKAVFPGEQGGPHVQIFAALALTFKLAKTPEFRKLQEQTVTNAVAMIDQFSKRGFRIPFGGTNCHLLNIDCNSIKGPDGTTLSGDMAARILDLAGIVVNSNTIPGDRNTASASGVRMGTPWITQRGFGEAKSRELADIISDLLLACIPHSVDTPRKGRVRRAKIDFGVLNEARLKVRKLAEEAGVDFVYEKSGYPHYYFIDDAPRNVAAGGTVVFDLRGERVRQFLDYAVSSDLSVLRPGKSQPSSIVTPGGEIKAVLTCVNDEFYQLDVPAEKLTLATIWLRDLSDGYVSIDSDPLRRSPGPIVIADAKTERRTRPLQDEEMDQGSEKPWFIGIKDTGKKESLPNFQWAPPPALPTGGSAEGGIKRTSLYDVHKSLGAKLAPFAGWDMPVWYTSVVEEHLATRQAAGLFDVSHMGVYEISGVDAASFLDSVCANDVGTLLPGESLYSHFLTPDAEVIDDTLVYRRPLAGTGRADKFLMVVNASNDDKARAWLESVRDGKVKIDNARPSARAYGYEADIRNLRDPQADEDMRVDIALQGPKSRDVLLALGMDAETRARIMKLNRTELCDATVGNPYPTGTMSTSSGGPFDLIVSRTGYTGEKLAFELFVHPERAADLWNAILKAGEPFGVKPVGLGARDSLRTEAGLPLYGHEMGLGSGPSTAGLGSTLRSGPGGDLGVAEGGFGSYVKLYKPWFIGREAYMANEKKRKGVVVRFRFDEQRVRMAHNGDPVVNAEGKPIGWVTSCAIDSQRFLTGLAYVELKYTAEGTPLGIHQGKDMDKPATAARVVSRFPKL